MTDQCLEILKTDWRTFQEKVHEWLEKHTEHKDVELIKQLANSQDRLRHNKIKSIRQLICSLCGSEKPWEIVVGQAIAQVQQGATAIDNMLVDFVGEEGFNAIVFRAFKPWAHSETTSSREQTLAISG